MPEEQPLSTAQGPLQAGGQDWLAIWRAMYDAEREQTEQASPPEFQRDADYWAPHAARFAVAARRAPQPDSFMRFLLPHLRPSDTLLDIGAGTGRYEPLLARNVARVLAVEPSAAMRERMARHLEEEHLENVELLDAGWPLPEPPACDVAMAAHVLYGVREVGPFLQQMRAVARRAGFLLLGLRQPSFYISPFWERLHGQRRLALPGALECMNVLFQLGIPANLTLIPANNQIAFADEQEALENIVLRLHLPPGPASAAVLRPLLGELLETDSQGMLRPHGLPPHSAVVWWTNE